MIKKKQGKRFYFEVTGKIIVYEKEHLLYPQTGLQLPTVGVLLIMRKNRFELQDNYFSI